MIVLIFSFSHVLLVKHFICFVPAQVARYVKPRILKYLESSSTQVPSPFHWNSALAAHFLSAVKQSTTCTL